MESWTVGPIATTNRGAKSANILTQLGIPPVKRLATATDPLTTPYGSSTFDPHSTRHSIDFTIDKPLQEWLQELDKWAQKMLLKESPRLFKKQLSKEEISQLYQSTIKKHEKDSQVFPDTVRCKFSVGKIKHWAWDHKAREAPVEYKNCDLVPMIQVKNFYFGTNQVGLVLEVSDMLVQEQVRECPF